MKLPNLIKARLFQPIDISSLVYFRHAFGILIFFQSLAYLVSGAYRVQYLSQKFYFKYYGFEWVKAFPESGMTLLFVVMTLSSFFVVIGFFYRLNATLFFLCFCYIFLLDQTHYLNHYYLICLLSFLMIFIPAHKNLSMDSFRKPELRSDTAPAWCLWALRAQIAIVYTYAGLVKINTDWLRGEPMRMWLSQKTDFPLIGKFFTEEWMVYLFTYGGLLQDLLVAPLLLWKKTRIPAFIATTLFHLLNAHLFSIFIFPWMMLAANLLFLPPDWPRRLFRLSKGSSSNGSKLPSSKQQSLTLAILIVYFAWQILFPARHLLYPGDVAWTEEGHRFSWQMLLRDKKAEAKFYLTDGATKKQWEVNPHDFLTPKQVKQMFIQPDLILQFAHFLASEYRKKGYHNVEVRATVRLSLNGRPQQLLIDPHVDLAKQPRNLAPAPWIQRPSLR